MNFQPVRSDSEIIGYEARNSHGLFFYGTQKGHLDKIQKHYTQFDFFQIRQVHGATLVQASHAESTADAQWSTQQGQAVGIQTADCLPVLLTHSKGVCAIHAGWRGLEAQILAKSLQTLLESWKDEAQCQVVIGPHIRPSHFEVGVDVADRLLRSHPEISPHIFTGGEVHPDSSKSFVSLLSLAQYQLLAGGIDPDQIHDCGDNTYNSPQYFSYRQTAGKAQGRQWSFVAYL